MHIWGLFRIVDLYSISLAYDMIEWFIANWWRHQKYCWFWPIQLVDTVHWCTPLNADWGNSNSYWNSFRPQVEMALVTIDILNSRYFQSLWKLKTVPKKMELALKYAINEKSTIFFQFLWNFVKMTYSLVDQIAKISAWYVQNCRLFTNSLFFNQFHFFRDSL